MHETFSKLRYSNVYEGVILVNQQIERAIAGDEVAFAQLLQTQKPRLLQRAYMYVKNRADAEDIVQQTFIQAHASLHQLRQPEYFATWLFKIMMRESFKALKKEARQQELERQLIQAFSTIEQHTMPYDELYIALQRIPRQYETALMLHYFYGFKALEMASMLNKPLNTVKMHLHRGRHALRLELEKLHHKRLQQKDVTRMLKEQLLKLATQFAEPTADQSLTIEDYANEASMFLWQHRSTNESTFVRLTADGKLDDFAKTPKHDGPRVTEEEQKQIATRFLHAQYPEALRYFTRVTATKQGDDTSFLFSQLVGDLPLSQYYCRVQVTATGEVIGFTYTGYCTNPPLMPKKLYDAEAIIDGLYDASWTLRAMYVEKEHVAVSENGIVLLYDTPHLHAVYDAVTGHPMSSEEQQPTYKAFPQVAATAKQTIEHILSITDEWERTEPELLFGHKLDDEQLIQHMWRKKGEAPASKTSQAFIEANFMNVITAKINRHTGRLYSFVKLMEFTEHMYLTDDDCLQLAAQFVQTYYAEYVPYLVVATVEQNEEQLSYQFMMRINGLMIEEDGFSMTVNRRAGQITFFRAPNSTVESLQHVVSENILPIESFAYPTFHATLQWEVNAEEQEPTEQLTYRITTTHNTNVLGIRATDGHVIYMKRNDDV